LLLQVSLHQRAFQDVAFRLPSARGFISCRPVSLLAVGAEMFNCPIKPVVSLRHCDQCHSNPGNFNGKKGRRRSCADEFHVLHTTIASHDASLVHLLCTQLGTAPCQNSVAYLNVRSTRRSACGVRHTVCSRTFFNGSTAPMGGLVFSCFGIVCSSCRR
jgi:hypothetical protein